MQPMHGQPGSLEPLQPSPQQPSQEQLEAQQMQLQQQQQQQMQQQMPYPGAVETQQQQQVQQQKRSVSGSYSVSGSGSSYYSQSSGALEDSPRENRVLTFSDEHGDPLCAFQFYAIGTRPASQRISASGQSPVEQNKEKCCCMG